MEVTGFSAIRTGRLDPLGDSSGTRFLEAESTQGHSAAGRITSMKN
jgi:hypothetical protein